MDTAFFIVMSLIFLAALVAIIFMVRNKLKGKDELHGLMNVKRKKMDKDGSV